MEKLLVKLTHGITLICGFIMLLMMLQVTADVVGSYIFNHPVPATAIMATSYYMVAIVFLPLAWVEISNGTIVVELAYDFAPKLLQRAMLALGAVATMLFYGVLTWLTWGPAMHAYEIGGFTTGTWNVVTWPSKFLLPVGLGLGCVVSALQFTRILTGRDGLVVKDSESDSSVSSDPI